MINSSVTWLTGTMSSSKTVVPLDLSGMTAYILTFIAGFGLCIIIIIVLNQIKKRKRKN